MSNEDSEKQNWHELYATTIVLKKNYDNKKEKQQAMRSGNTITQQKQVTKTKLQSTDLNKRKLDEHSDAGAHKKIEPKLAKLILHKRTKLGWTQAMLANKLQVKPNIIQEYESGKAIPNNSLLQKIKTKLGIKKEDLQ